MIKNIGIVLNPTAARGKAGRIFPQLLSILHEVGIKTLVEITERPGHGDMLAARLARKGVDAVISAGGDGTLNEVLNGLANLNFPVPMGALGIGTGNDFLKSAGTAKDLLKQVEVIKQGNIKLLDLMRITYCDFGGNTAVRYSINDFGVGFPAKVSFRVNNMKGALKGAWSYAAAVITEIRLNKPVQLKLETPEGSFKGFYNMLFAMIGQYVGGGIKKAPMAVVDDGYMDVLFVEQLTRWETLKLLPKAFKGTHLPHPKVTHIRTRELSVNDTQELVYVQGEVIGFTPAHIELLPQKVPFLWPS